MKIKMNRQSTKRINLRSNYFKIDQIKPKWIEDRMDWIWPKWIKKDWNEPNGL